MHQQSTDSTDSHLTQKLPDFLGDLQESAEKAFRDNAHQMIENLLYAKVPPHLKKSINQAYLENGTYDQIVRHLEREMEPNDLEAEEHPFSKLK